jgi:adenosylcobinamide kinase / adenosylcobinamide-phosphate guanylyltransferase
LPDENSCPAGRACLVIGGARSGKSAYAQALAEGSGLRPVYVATATVWDAEMADRVDRHRAARDASWRTVEEPVALADVLVRNARADAIVLVDCLTLWLTNLMLGGHDVEQHTQRLLDTLAQRSGPVIIVTNEVGQGIVPENRLARDFRDRQGRLNQAVAQACDTVVLVTAGLPLQIKPALPPAIAFT